MFSALRDMMAKTKVEVETRGRAVALKVTMRLFE
jgi:hypothetical protein